VRAFGAPPGRASAEGFRIARLVVMSAMISTRSRRSTCASAPALYLLAYEALRVRVSRTFGRGRLVAKVACGLLLPIAVVVPALVFLAFVAAVWVALHAYDIEIVDCPPRGTGWHRPV
jgi:hypothetical protein